MDTRLKTNLWVQAQVRTGYLQDMPVVVLAKGDPDRGGILLKIDQFEKGILLFESGLDFDGQRVWRAFSRDPVDEQTAKEKIARKRSFDEDLWVLEIEDRHATYCLDAPIEQL
ncbi:hypothetical protein GCM10017044_07680 [Kordiimonas sediminis]|uniref:DUF1491 family protein n=1 Tax=Kordiimonas sediminis TaxID=1735581 RepID=A0A919E621_9PROT|nr:DUF1491 family protein [Kordiimonas sediminis]GHF15908.1 hypothetical protein GCM10017044_07680 [Kordiimonas sediminis]